MDESKIRTFGPKSGVAGGVAAEESETDPENETPQPENTNTTIQKTDDRDFL